MTDLTGFTKEQLELELERRRIEEQNEIERRRIDRNRLILQHKDSLLALLEHGRTSCATTDNSWHNEQGYPRCNKCALEVFDEHCLDEYDIEISISMKRVK